MARVVRELLEAVILALIVFLVIQGSVRNFKVEGSSMYPTLETGEYLLINKLVYFPVDTHRLSRVIPFWKVDQSAGRFAARAPERGEVIVFRFPGAGPPKDFVKRVVGLPGEHVEIRDGAVYIGGEPLLESHIDPGETGCDLVCDLTLKANEYYVLGDNRGSSNDSRSWGPVPEENVLGKVWFVYWPLSELHLLDSFSSLAHSAFRQVPWP